LSLFSFGSKRPGNLGVRSGRLSPCPCSPNCVSTDADDIDHNVPAFELAIPTNDAWSALRAAVAQLPRTKIVEDKEDYIHAECRSAVFGFVDDLEFHLRSKQSKVAVRSAARLGHSDFGVNRKRVEGLRALLRQQGVIT